MQSIIYITNIFINLSTWQILCWIYTLVFVILFILSCFGRKLGLRKIYTKFLLKIFEFSNNKLQKKRKKQQCFQISGDDDGDISASETFLTNPNLSLEHPHSLGTNINGYQLDDILPYITAGMATIVEDSVIPQFVSEELPYWNLLSRTNTKSYEFISLRLTVFWVVGFVLRYFLLLPLRVIILIVGMIVFFICSLIVGPLPDGSFKRDLNALISTICFDFVAGCLSLVATFHDIENRPTSGIAVANHTSPIDAMILATDTCYDMVGQKHGGLLGIFMRILSRSSSHIWFERFETRDKILVMKRLREHAHNVDLPPILIFPEGVCVNNTSVMQFRKGAFEVADEIHPVAIKFDPRFGDVFWWQDCFFSYVLYMMTTWAVVCDVWYLPRMKREKSESAVEFAKRVKGAIAEKGGLTDVSWDGFLKASEVKSEWLEQQKLAFANYLLTEPKSSMKPDLKDDFVPKNFVTDDTFSKVNDDVSSSLKNLVTSDTISSVSDNTPISQTILTSVSKNYNVEDKGIQVDDDCISRKRNTFIQDGV